jgi:PAS domain S-box-containing protein
VSFKPVKNDHNIIIGCVAIIKNISKQKEEVLKIESSLHEQNELFQMVNDENPDIILMRDYDGKFLFVNDALAKLYATTPEEMIGKTDETFNPNKEQRDFFLENIRTIMDKFETEVIYETSTDVHSGEIRYFKSIKKPLKDKHGNLSILVIAHDITDIKENELKLQQFAAVTKNSREGVMIVDTHKNILAINDSFTTITGYSEEDAIGQKITILRSGEHSKNFYDNMWESINTKDKLS